MPDYLESYKRTEAKTSALRVGVLKDPTKPSIGLSTKWDATVSACPSSSTEPAEPRTRSRRLDHDSFPRFSLCIKAQALGDSHW